MQSAVHFLVSGRVQGVFFRASCKRVADQNRITGWVRNLPDGRVEGMATANPDELRLLQDWLKRGPERASITRLDISEHTLQEFDGFEIRY